jgi:hypothetical protein
MQGSNQLISKEMVMNTVDEIIEIVKSISEGKQYVEATHTVNNFVISIYYVSDRAEVTISEKNNKKKRDEIYVNNMKIRFSCPEEITIYLTNCDQDKLTEALFREVVDLTARNLRGKKKNIKDETIKNIRDTYQKITGNSIESKVGSSEPYKEVSHYLCCIKDWNDQDISMAYRIIASQSRKKYEYAMFVYDLKLLLNHISAFNYDFDDLQLKLEESLLMNI